MGRGPNANGGRRNVGNNKGPARARFSNWRPANNNNRKKKRGGGGRSRGGGKEGTSSRSNSRALEREYRPPRREKESVHMTHDDILSKSLPCIANLQLSEESRSLVTDLLALLQSCQGESSDGDLTRHANDPSVRATSVPVGKKEDTSSSLPVSEDNHKLSLCNYLTKTLGFKYTDVKLAISVNTKQGASCKLADVLDYLCLTLSEPAVVEALKNSSIGATSNIKVYQGEEESMQLEALAFKISQLGFDIGRCKIAVNSLKLAGLKHEELEHSAVWNILASIRDTYSTAENNNDNVIYDENSTVIEDEKLVLESIYGSENVHLQADSRLCVSVNNGHLKYSTEVVYPKGYPTVSPLILVKTEHLKKHQKEKLMLDIARECAKLRGEAMIYDIIVFASEKIEASLAEQEESVNTFSNEVETLKDLKKSKNVKAAELYAEQFWTRHKQGIRTRTEKTLAKDKEELEARMEYEFQRENELKEMLRKDSMLQKTAEAYHSNKEGETYDKKTQPPMKDSVKSKSSNGNGTVGASLCDVLKRRKGQTYVKNDEQTVEKAKSKNILDQQDDDIVRLNSIPCLSLEPEEMNQNIQQISDAMYATYSEGINAKKREYNRMMTQRRRLPAYEMRNKIVQTIESNRVVVISGETGCGKTTQVPQLVYEYYMKKKKAGMLNIVCTQPRRISAIGVAERVASEQLENIGGTVGYSIRLESKRSKKTKILFCTTGLLLRQIQTNPNLDGISHLFIDEVHERSRDTDFLLVIVRRLMRSTNRKLRLILMSATLNADLFSKYFGSVPILNIPGRTFPVDTFYLEEVIDKTKYEFSFGSEYMYHQPKFNKQSSSSDIPSPENKTDFGTLLQWYPKCKQKTLETLKQLDQEKVNYDLIESLLRYLCLQEASVEAAGKGGKENQGAVLIFMPGLAEISNMYNQLQMDASEFGNKSKYLILPLHSSLSTEEQKRVFKRPKRGVRKIVIGTNIAETSITIDDVTVVIDSGRVKENRYDENKKMCTLMETWVSAASAKQRAGRAGRVQRGTCFKLFTSKRKLDEYTLPEMLRQPLDDIILQIKVLKLGNVQSFLREAISPPSNTAIENAIKVLKGIKAIEVDMDMVKEKEKVHTDEEVLTPLGYHLASLPVDPRIGKMMVLGSIFRCLDPVLTIAAGMSCARSPFVAPFEKRELADQAKHALCGEFRSDHLAILEAYNQWTSIKKLRLKAGSNRKTERDFLRANFLSLQVLQAMSDLRKQFRDQLVDIGFAYRKRYMKEKISYNENENSGNIELIRMVLGAALYPNIIAVNYNQMTPDKLKKTRMATSIKENSKMDFRTIQGPVNIHPSCIVSNYKSVRDLGSRLLVFFEQLKTSKVFIRDATVISPYSVLLFGGDLIVNHVSNNIVLDGWLKFSAPAKVGVLVKLIRQQLSSILWEKIEQPTFHNEVSDQVITAIGILVQTITSDFGNL